MWNFIILSYRSVSALYPILPLLSINDYGIEVGVTNNYDLFNYY